jgi:phosphoglycerate dehydrogenase-like enzyme
MSTPVLIIDPNADFYRSQLAGPFPSVEFRTVRQRSEVTAALLADAQVIVGLGTHHVFDEQLLADAKALKWIQALTTGTDGVTHLRNLRKDVLVTSNTGIHGPQMAEMAIMHMMNLARQTPRMWENQKKAHWERWIQVRLYGKTVVILGVGSVSQALAPRCKALGMTVLGVSATPRDLPGFDRIYARSQLLEAVGQADFLVLLLPLTPHNENLVNAKLLAAMKPSAYLVNLARGAVVDEEALLETLRSKRIAGAALDIFRQIPLPPEHPFWKLDNVIISPNVAGGSEANHRMNVPIIEKNLRCFLQGRPQEMMNLVKR